MYQSVIWQIRVYTIEPTVDLPDRGVSPLRQPNAVTVIITRTITNANGITSLPLTETSSSSKPQTYNQTTIQHPASGTCCPPRLFLTIFHSHKGAILPKQRKLMEQNTFSYLVGRPNVGKSAV